MNELAMNVSDIFTQELKDQKDIHETKKKRWDLTKEPTEKINSEEKATNDLIADVIYRHFPKNISAGVLLGWFNEAATDFFDHNRHKWYKITVNKFYLFGELEMKPVGKHELNWK